MTADHHCTWQEVTVAAAGDGPMMTIDAFSAHRFAGRPPSPANGLPHYREEPWCLLWQPDLGDR
jgi:hypothetical protein